MPLTKEEQHFRSVAPTYMRMLLADFPMLDVLDAAAVFGNGGHESKGLTDDQEDKPVVAGSRGGLNWMQWTGPRRKAMEAYCARNKLDPASDIAAYRWLFLELKGAEKKAIPALLRATTLKGKVETFEKAFLRAGVKHYASRLKWAEIALDAFGDTAAEPPSPIPDLPAPETVEERPVEDYEQDIAPAPAKPSKPAWLHLVLIFGAALLVGVAVWLFGQAPPAEEVSLLGSAPFPRDRPFGLMGGGNLAADIGLQIALAFVMPLVSAAATAAVGWIVYWWQRVLKADFDAKSANALHAALERGMLAAIEAFGPKAGKSKLLNFTANYAATNNSGSVRHFKLAHDDLEHLAVPHLVTAKAMVG